MDQTDLTDTDVRRFLCFYVCSEWVIKVRSKSLESFSSLYMQAQTSPWAFFSDLRSLSQGTWPLRLDFCYLENFANFMWLFERLGVSLESSPLKLSGEYSRHTCDYMLASVPDSSFSVLCHNRSIRYGKNSIVKKKESLGCKVTWQ